MKNETIYIIISVSGLREVSRPAVSMSADDRTRKVEAALNTIFWRKKVRLFIEICGNDK